MKWNVFYQGLRNDERAVLGVDSNFKLILGNYYEAGQMTDEEVWNLILNHNRLSTKYGKISDYSIQIATPLDGSEGFIPNTLELWIHE